MRDMSDKLATTTWLPSFMNAPLTFPVCYSSTFQVSASTLKMSAAEEFPTVTTGQPHLAKQDLSKLVGK